MSDQLHPFTTQGNLRQGDWNPIANSDLTGKTGRLLKIVNKSGIVAVDLPATKADVVTQILVDDGAYPPDSVVGQPVTARPLSAITQGRVPVASTSAGGVSSDALVLADPTANAGLDSGNVIKLPVASGTYFRIGYALESYVAGQLVKFTPAPALVVVP